MVIIKKILSTDVQNKASIAVFLFNKRNENIILNINVLTDHINTLNDLEYKDFIENIFDKRDSVVKRGQYQIEAFVEKITAGLKANPENIHNSAFSFALQVSPMANFVERSEFIEECSRLILNGLKTECFEFVNRAKAKPIIENLDKLRNRNVF